MLDANCMALKRMFHHSQAILSSRPYGDERITGSSRRATEAAPIGRLPKKYSWATIEQVAGVFPSSSERELTRNVQSDRGSYEPQPQEEVTLRRQVPTCTYNSQGLVRIAGVYEKCG